MAFLAGDTVAVATDGMFYTDPSGTTVRAKTISPTVDIAAGGQTFTITGSGFGTTSGSVSFGGESATLATLSDTQITGTVPAYSISESAETITVTVTGSSGLTDTLSFTYVEANVFTGTIDRDGVCQIFTNMLKADTSVLYGAGKLVQAIEYDPVQFSKATVNNANPYKIYVWAVSEGQDVRMQSEDSDYLIGMTIVGIKTQLQAAIQQMDDIYERVKLLSNRQMWNGTMLRPYYTDSQVNIFNIETTTSELEPPDTDETGHLVASVEGAVLVQVNRVN